MTRLKDQIRLAKKAIKQAKINPQLYTEHEIQYMALQLARAKILLKAKKFYLNHFVNALESLIIS